MQCKVLFFSFHNLINAVLNLPNIQWQHPKTPQIPTVLAHKSIFFSNFHPMNYKKLHFMYTNKCSILSSFLVRLHTKTPTRQNSATRYMHPQIFNSPGSVSSCWKVLLNYQSLALRLRNTRVRVDLFVFDRLEGRRDPLSTRVPLLLGSPGETTLIGLSVGDALGTGADLAFFRLLEIKTSKIFSDLDSKP